MAEPAAAITEPEHAQDDTSTIRRAASADTAPAAPDALDESRAQPQVQRGLVDDIEGGVSSIAGGVRDRVLHTVAGYARRLPGYELLCIALGRDVVAGTPVVRSAGAIINGVLGLIPRGDELRQHLQESAAVERAGAWFDEQIPQLGLSWDAISGMFRRAWDRLSASDLLDPEGAWQRISGIFAPTLARLRGFAIAGGQRIMEFVFEGAMTMAGGLGQQVMDIMRRAGDVFNQILRDPVGFGRNLIEAVRGGLGQFLSNIATHLRNGLIGWLTGAIRGAIHVPAEFNLRGILGMAMEFLGLTWANVRSRIVALIGERAMSLLERGVGIVRDVVQNGISALIGRIAQFTSGLVETVISGIRDWVTNSVVGAAITRLISMFNPAGAVIQAIIAIYNTIKFFIERAQQLGALANSIFDSIAAIAGGSLGNAVNAVEQALGRAVPVVLGFLARLIGLGDVATPVRNVMTRVQGAIGSAIDRVVSWISGMARRFVGAVRGSGARAGAPEPAPGSLSAKQAAVDRAVEEVERLASQGAQRPTLVAALPGIKQRFGLTALGLNDHDGELSVTATINPSKTALVVPKLQPGQLRQPPTAPFTSFGFRAGGAVDPELLAQAVAYRASTVLDLDSFRSNFAVFRIKTPKGSQYICSHNDPSALHSEALLLAELQSMGGPSWYLNGSYAIEQIYTDRQPCESCGPHLRAMPRTCSAERTLAHTSASSTACCRPRQLISAPPR